MKNLTNMFVHQKQNSSFKYATVFLFNEGIKQLFIKKYNIKE